ncbi:hypothetical protein BDV59DRAFT_69043 [Aspergillus ambiguus]|uniref:uncharacterized protein n=1 Tax=Aspergillus ambiguus TaxID=176160 RepID=UPI003CCCEA4D
MIDDESSMSPSPPKRASPAPKRILWGKPITTGAAASSLPRLRFFPPSLSSPRRLPIFNLSSSHGLFHSLSLVRLVHPFGFLPRSLHDLHSPLQSYNTPSIYTLIPSPLSLFSFVHSPPISPRRLTSQAYLSIVSRGFFPIRPFVNLDVIS